MVGSLMRLSIRSRWIVVLLAAIVAGIGAWQLSKLPIDAVPDITNKQVQINTLGKGLSPIEMEKRVTFPIETALAGIPGLQNTRSLSRNGFSQVTAIFSDTADLYFARQQVGERLTQARGSLPDDAQPQIGPVTTGLGEVFMYSVDFSEAPGKRTPVPADQSGWQADGSYLTPEGERLADDVSQAAYLRTVQDWIIKPQLRTVRGVAGVDSIGGYEKQYIVEPNPVKLSAYGISYSELAKGIEANNLAIGANYFNRGGEAFLVRGDARIRALAQIADAIIATRGGIPVAVKDVATIKLGGDLRTGAASVNGHEAVIGTVLMLIGENSRVVARLAAEKLDSVVKSLPPGVKITPLLDRSQLVSATVGTVQKNLAEGAVLVAAALFLLLGNIRAAVIAVLVIPFSFLLMAIGMNALKVSGNLMSLGALDFGLIVDGAVIIIENCLARLAERRHKEGRPLTLDERLAETAEASRQMVRPTISGQIIILLAFAPLLMFTGVEGKTFSPMAITIMLALVAAFLLSLTLVPALLALLVKGDVAEKETRVILWTKARVEPLVDWAVARPWPVIAIGTAFFLACIPVFGFLGQEFIPQLDEKNVALSSIRIPSVSLEQSRQMQQGIEQAVTTLPEVAMMFSKTGTAEVATDPMPPNVSDGFIILKVQEEWPAGVTTKAEVLKRIEEKASSRIGQSYEVSQPIQLRFNELIAGVRGDVAIKLFGDDLDKMGAAAADIAKTLRSISGAADVRVEQISGSPVLDVRFDRSAIARYGLTVEEVADTISTGMGSREAGLIFDGDRRFPVTVRVPEATRENLDALAALPVMLPEIPDHPRKSIPLSSVAEFRFAEGLTQVSRENGKRRVVIQANVRGRDVGSFVTEAEDKVSRITLPVGTYLEWGGQFQNLQAAARRLAIVVPLCFAAIFLLLYKALGGFGRALSVFLAIPPGLAGGVYALALTGIAFSVSAAVGFICLAGVAVLNGLVVMSAIGPHLDAGVDLSRAIIYGTREKIRPVIMTGLVPAIGFVPMALAQGTGAEVQRPLATVVIGGLIAATILSLLVLPAVAKLVLSWTERRPDA